jgi:hypothetical protein
MKCEEFEDQLNLALDQHRRPEWDPELRIHGDGCAECCELAALYGLLLDGFYALATPEPPADLAIRVVDLARVRPALSRRVSIVAAVLATAAVALVALLPLVRDSGDRSGKMARTPSRPALASSVVGDDARKRWEDIDALPVVGPMLVSLSDDDDTTDPYMELAKGTGQGLASVVLYIPRIGSTPGAIGMATDVINGDLAWPERMNKSLKPVTESVGETLDLLLRALPLSDSSNRS